MYPNIWIDRWLIDHVIRRNKLCQQANYGYALTLKYNKATQASITLVGTRTKINTSDNIPTPKDRVICAIVQGTIVQYKHEVKDYNTPAVD